MMAAKNLKTLFCLFLIRQVAPSPILPPQIVNGTLQVDSKAAEVYTAEENKGNAHVTEGDIYLDKSTKLILDELKDLGRDAITNPVFHWPGRRVPYTFGPVGCAVKSAVKQAIAQFNKHTCIRLVPRTKEKNYIYIVSEEGCWSSIGRSGGKQKLSLDTECAQKIGTVIHEIMHALGFFHEQSRLDRDKYVTINFGNILRGFESNFQKYRHGQADTLNEPYDLGSVMHYSEMAFSANGRPTIVAKGNPNTQLGQRNGFSRIDIRQINKLYKCKGGGGGGESKPKPIKPQLQRPGPRPRPPDAATCRVYNRYCSSRAESTYCRIFRPTMKLFCSTLSTVRVGAEMEKDHQR